ncbi:hypothetical protein ANN_01610 [Periplaneta americana]|uniref:Uncharacterized protein n=1 Tax=Periplaneta americana TaxID=6978 RepID=A0ABQ8TV59_PERAM|nr:hypothetical protein ANN_01610 [Periplaneta americana]
MLLPHLHKVQALNMFWQWEYLIGVSNLTPSSKVPFLQSYSSSGTSAKPPRCLRDLIGKCSRDRNIEQNDDEDEIVDYDDDNGQNTDYYKNESVDRNENIDYDDEWRTQNFVTEGV